MASDAGKETGVPRQKSEGPGMSLAKHRTTADRGRAALEYSAMLDSKAAEARRQAYEEKQKIYLQPGSYTPPPIPDERISKSGRPMKGLSRPARDLSNSNHELKGTPRELKDHGTLKALRDWQKKARLRPRVSEACQEFYEKQEIYNSRIEEVETLNTSIAELFKDTNSNDPRINELRNAFNEAQRKYQENSSGLQGKLEGWENDISAILENEMLELEDKKEVIGSIRKQQVSLIQDNSRIMYENKKELLKIELTVCSFPRRKLGIISQLKIDAAHESSGAIG